MADGVRVLVVEDEWLIAEDHAATLRGAGHDVAGPCATVAAALGEIGNGGIDVALLDIELGAERSFPVAERLQQLGIPFLFLSGFPKSDLPPALRRTQVMAKPVEEARLLAAVDTLARAAPGARAAE